MYKKIIWEFDNFPEFEKEKYARFRSFNEFIEKNNISCESVHDSYLKVLSEEDFKENIWSYNELDFQVKKIIEESWTAVNEILWFLESKYDVISILIIDLFYKYNIKTTPRYVKDLLNKWIWIIDLNWVKIKFDFISKSFMDWLRELEEQIKNYKTQKAN